ncbi:MAG: nucleoside recognition protein, partial [Defluviitaleaceae bacterium]|nr:nucleoside recognition protein [Defluviitaleaceae bacterium]
MLNYLWMGMIIIGVVVGAITGNMAEITNAAVDSAREAVMVCLTMLGIMAMWTGLMKIAERAGLIQSISGRMRPILRFLFPRL